MELKFSAKEAVAICDEVRPLLAGKGPEVQGAVLAELVAMWLSGFSTNGDEVVEAMLQGHIGAVRLLLPLNKQRMRERFS